MKKFTFAIVAILFLTGLGVRAATDCYTKTHPPTEFVLDMCIDVVDTTVHPSDVNLSVIKNVVAEFAERETAVAIKTQNYVLKNRSWIQAPRSGLLQVSEQNIHNKPPNIKQLLAFNAVVSTKAGWCSGI